MPLPQDIKVEFEGIASQASLVAFTNKLGLSRTDEVGQSAVYKGNPWGLAVEIRERWRDPSNVYSPQVDKHEAVLLLNGNAVATIRFFGNS